jgi:hypothetical protein
MPKPVGNVFTLSNYFLILTSVLLLIAGFLLMTGRGNKIGESFNTDIYSFRRITLAPVVLLAGYVLLIYGIMKAPDKNKAQRND